MELLPSNDWGYNKEPVISKTVPNKPRIMNLFQRHLPKFDMAGYTAFTYTESLNTVASVSGKEPVENSVH